AWMWYQQYVFRTISSRKAWSGQAGLTHVAHAAKTSGDNFAHTTSSQNAHPRRQASHDKCPRLHRATVAAGDPQA
ncbi:MAG: hypothetical protein AABY30_02375, partial [Candidatus Thermoplasmatota archaeon]